MNSYLRLKLRNDELYADIRALVSERTPFHERELIRAKYLLDEQMEDHLLLTGEGDPFSKHLWEDPDENMVRKPPRYFIPLCVVMAVLVISAIIFILVMI